MRALLAVAISVAISLSPAAQAPASDDEVESKVRSEAPRAWDVARPFALVEQTRDLALRQRLDTLDSPPPRAVRASTSLSDVQHALRSDEVLIQYALAEPASVATVITRTTARVQSLTSRSEIVGDAQALLAAIANDRELRAVASRLGDVLLSAFPELMRNRRLVVSADGELHGIPFEVLITSSGKPLLDTHVVSYVPSASVLVVLRRTGSTPVSHRRALAVSASPRVLASVATASGNVRLTPSFDGVIGAPIRQLPGAEDEARAVVRLLGEESSTMLAGDAGTEGAVKRAPLHTYAVLHFAAHGLLSAQSPAGEALLMQPDAIEDGVLRASEIRLFRLSAALVTLSACDTSSGMARTHGGASTLVRTFLTVGAKSVVANLWAADDTFSLALMRVFYRHLATGVDVAEALRLAKRTMVATFGPQATPRLWSGVLAYGDGGATVTATPLVTSQSN